METLLQRIHRARTSGEITTLKAEISALGLDTNNPGDYHYFYDHVGREINKRANLLGIALPYASSRSGLRPNLGTTP